jgi:ribonucleoside-diphosphate reductase alpha chain
MTSELWDKCDEVLPDIKKLREEFGIRNSMLLATAPNTTTSLTMGSTASFLPPYQLEFYDESEDHSLNVLVKYMPNLYFTNFQVNPLFITAATKAIQKWTDAGISMEYLLPNSASWSTNKAFSELKIGAWIDGIKAVYYIRSTEDAQSPGGCSACAN